MRVVADAPTHTELDEVTRWRRVALIRAGYPPKLARAIADRHDIDLHQALELVKAGCPAGVAFRILR